jgi:hypothetical protein
VYFRILWFYVFYVVSFTLTESYILSALVGHCDDCRGLVVTEYATKVCILGTAVLTRIFGRREDNELNMWTE